MTGPLTTASRSVPRVKQVLLVFEEHFGFVLMAQHAVSAAEDFVASFLNMRQLFFVAHFFCGIRIVFEIILITRLLNRFILE